MKKINLLYLAILPVVYVVLQIYWNYGEHSTVFYGFAETKETEINHDHPVQVNKILVTPGQLVKKGELLIEASHSRFGLKMNDLSHDIEALRLRVEERRTELKNDIRILEAQRAGKVNDIEAQIARLQADIDLNRSLLKDLQSVEVPETTGQASPNQVKLTALKRELQTVTQPIDVELANLRQALALANTPLNVQIEKLRNEQDFYAGEEQDLSIVAPSDGLIGNIHCKEGEHKSSYATLITFYEQNPTLVSGYVHENLILHVQVGDTLEVSSSLHTDHRGYGTVIGLGSRIVEIPDRLRKVPDMKTYGREVLISIPADNPFLQKEKVVLNFLDLEGLPGSSIIDFFTNPPSTTQAQPTETPNTQR